MGNNGDRNGRETDVETLTHRSEHGNNRVWTVETHPNVVEMKTTCRWQKRQTNGIEQTKHGNNSGQQCVWKNWDQTLKLFVLTLHIFWNLPPYMHYQSNYESCDPDSGRLAKSGHRDATAHHSSCCWLLADEGISPGNQWNSPQGR
jgi:hypothetical protein